MEEKNINIYEKLSNIQQELKAPKNQYNSFGKYKYRSCEDILEGVKPVCNKHRATLVIRDELELLGDRFYVKAIATLYDWDSDMKIENSAYAREELTKKGMDSSQITGATSSYARKYALNGLFNIDDTKDADTDAYANQTNHKSKRQQTQAKPQQSSVQSKKEENATRESMLEYLVAMYKEYKENVAMYIKPLLKANNVKVVSDLNNEQLTTLYTAIKSNEKGIKGL
jgi:hypothetical protein